MFFKKIFTPTRSADNFEDAIIEYEGRSILFLPFFKGINTLNIGQLDCEKTRNIKDVYIPKTIYNDGNNGNFLIELYKRCEGLENIFVEESSNFENYCLGKSLNSKNEKIYGIYPKEKCTIDKNESKEIESVIEFSTIGNDIISRIIEDYENINYFLPKDGCVKLPDEIKTIKEKTFLNNEDIITIEANGVTKIEDNAFEGCTNLANVYITGITDTNELGNDIFKNCHSLEAIWTANKEICKKINENLSEKPNVTILYGCPPVIYDRFSISSDGILTINENIKKIKKGHFINRNDIKEIKIPCITEIEDGAFMGCQNLENVYITGITDTTRLGKNIFENCNKLKNIYTAKREICSIICENSLDKANQNKVTSKELNLFYGEENTLYKPGFIYW